ncbi:MAG: Yip1 family protein [Methylocystis sp.]
MNLLSRIKGLILKPQTEWAQISEEDTSVFDLYRNYVAILALLPPFASFFGSWLFGFSYGSQGIVHPTFAGGLYRAFVQYLFSLPAFFLVAFVISAIAPHFEGRTDDRRALMLTAYSYTPV